MDWLWIAGAAFSGIAAIVVWQYLSVRGTYRPLASRQPQMDAPEAPELGMEAIDMAEIHRTQRSNESLERTSNIWTRRSASDLKIKPMADDETYAQRFHAAFMKNKD